MQNAYHFVQLISAATRGVSSSCYYIEGDEKIYGLMLLIFIKGFFLNWNTGFLYIPDTAETLVTSTSTSFGSDSDQKDLCSCRFAP
jgi:hypothetical protein